MRWRYLILPLVRAPRWDRDVAAAVVPVTAAAIGRMLSVHRFAIRIALYHPRFREITFASPDSVIIDLEMLKTEVSEAHHDFDRWARGEPVMVESPRPGPFGRGLASEGVDLVATAHVFAIVVTRPEGTYRSVSISTAELGRLGAEARLL